MEDQPTKGKWTIRRVMVGIACLAPLLALARYPLAFGFVASAGAILLFVVISYRKRQYHRIACLICFYPAVPLAVLFLSWWLLRIDIVQRSSMGVLDGMFGISDIGALICIIVYPLCIPIPFSGADPALKRAAKQVLIFMPVVWGLLLVFALLDPLGVLSAMFRF